MDLESHTPQFIEGVEKKIQQLKSLMNKELISLAEDIRQIILSVVSKNGGHLSSNLGVVDLTIALYKCFNFPVDTLIFDVGHQAYTHKILSGRLKKFSTLRRPQGLSGFTDPAESPYDIAHIAHAGTSISTGMSIANVKKQRRDTSFTLVLIGDASIANGVSFEALNTLRDRNLDRYIVLLNDNQMSISQVVGGLSWFLTRMISHPFYHRSKRKVKKFLGNFGQLPNKMIAFLLKRFRILIYSNYFDSFGIRYIGPINGHDFKEMEQVFRNIQNNRHLSNRPILIHILTVKGKGVENAELYPEDTHGVSPSFNNTRSAAFLLSQPPKAKTYTQIFGETLVELQDKYQNITATTAAMTKGTGLTEFAKKYPSHFFDMGISESHSVIFSSFLTYKETYKPYIAIYSTFFQRAIDQVFHDVCLQFKSPVFVLDRAGLVGEDGPTHHGIYDIACLRSFPGTVLVSPLSGKELTLFLYWSYHQNFPIFIRFPKAEAYEDSSLDLPPIELGKGHWVHRDSKAEVIFVIYGPLLKEILALKEELPPHHIINIRFAKPLDSQLLQEAFLEKLPMIVLEEHASLGGIGEAIQSLGCQKRYTEEIFSIGIPDSFISHNTRQEQLKEVGLSGVFLKQQVFSVLERAKK